MTGRRAGPGAAIMARNQDHIRLGLRHPGRNGADPDGRHQLDRHLGARVDLFEVIDQLRQILDRIDIVVRRRGNQRHARRRMPQPRDQLGHFHARQAATLTGLGALGDLDLQLFALVQIFRCHAKPADWPPA